MAVRIENYEGIGEGVTLLADHFREILAVQKDWLAIAEQLGGVTVRPGNGGAPPSTLLFDGVTPPTGWIAVRMDSGMVEARPHKATKAGRHALELMAKMRRVPTGQDIARTFGYSPATFPTDGRSIYFATAQHLALPSSRYFLRIPRTEGDSWTPPPILKLVRDSEYLTALEAHNDAVRARQEAA